MKFLPYLLGFAVFFSLAAFSNRSMAETFDQVPSREVKVNNLYSMMIPKHMEEDTSLNDEASLEYADPTDELYIIVIDEITQEFVDAFKGDPSYDNSKSVIENYAIVQKESIVSMLTSSTTVTELKYEKVNGLKSYTFTASGFVEGITPEILYKVRFFQGKEHVYMVMTWTLTSSHKENLKEMDQMLDSFREL
jgi:hypothetical protein